MREELAIGAAPSSSSDITTGRIVESDSGKRLVRKSVDACRYILEICDDELRDDNESEREDIELLSS